MTTGLILLDKPAGISSFGALGAVKRSLGIKKVGHAGTLDPFATGLLVVLSGKLTKLAGLFTDLDKTYEAVFRFGLETDTLDTEGEVIASAPVPSLERIERRVPQFSGEIKQTPPSFSAVKIKGKRAYSLARSGLELEMPQRTVTIHDFSITSWSAPYLGVRIRCSKGTYIRSLARDLAVAAGSRGYCHSLRRTSVGPFSVDAAVKPEDFGTKHLQTPGEVFRNLDFPCLRVEEAMAKAMRQGRPLPFLEANHPQSKMILEYWEDSCGEPVALTENKGRTRQYRIVFD